MSIQASAPASVKELMNELLSELTDFELSLLNDSDPTDCNASAMRSAVHMAVLLNTLINSSEFKKFRMMGLI